MGQFDPRIKKKSSPSNKNAPQEMAPREGDVKSQPSERVPCGRGVRRVRQWFLCVLALCHVAAFSSLYLQWPGLYGEAGIMPAHQAKPEGVSLCDSINNT